MLWEEEYKRKLISVEEAARLVKSGDSVAVAWAQGTPPDLCEALSARKDELEGVKINHSMAYGIFDWAKEGAQKAFNVVTGFRYAENRTDLLGLPIESKVVFLPISFSFFPHWEEDEARESGVDIFMVKIGAPDKDGYCSLGETVWASKTFARQAKMVIGEIHPGMIRTFGDTRLHLSEVDYLVEHQGPPTRISDEIVVKILEQGRVEQIEVIAANIAELIRDGDTVQFGTGDIAYALPPYLRAKHDLGMHSEIIGPEVLDLVKEGVMTGKYKTLHPGKVLAATFSFLVASEERLSYIDNNPAFELYDVTYMNNPRVIAQNDNMVAVNNAISIDLTGQIAAESIGPQMWSSTGGQLDFTLGAWFSRGGRAVVALPSNAHGGEVSRIVPTLEPGTVVSIPRTLADFVVTEYGIANLAGRSVRERAQELIPIAHPDFRAELRREAEKL